MLSKEFFAELSAIHAGAALLERSIQKETNIPLDEEQIFDFVQVRKVFSLQVNTDGFFEPFDMTNRPKHIKHIREIKQVNSLQYLVEVRVFANNDQIQNELDSLYLPF